MRPPPAIKRGVAGRHLEASIAACTFNCGEGGRDLATILSGRRAEHPNGAVKELCQGVEAALSEPDLLRHHCGGGGSSRALEGRNEMRAFLCSALMALTITTAGAQADKDSAVSILPDCKAAVDGDRSGDGFARGFCVGTVLGLAFMAENSDVRVAALSGEGQARWFDEKWHCVKIPDSVTQGQIVGIVVLYIEARPERMQEPFRSLALEALFDAWSCQS